MLGTLADTLPDGDDWSFEPKWDGFRVVVFRDGAAIDLRSRDDRPLARYFPEVVEALAAALPDRCVADGEIVIVRDGALDFEALQHRLHPAASRVSTLSARTPAGAVLWDLLAEGDEDLRDRPFGERRARLAQAVRTTPVIQRTPSTEDRALALDWFERFEGAGLDGVMAKRLADPYRPGKRAMVKVKHVRTIDAVVAGFRWHKGARGTEVGSLVLGLFGPDGRLNPIGVAASFSKRERARLVEVLAPLRIGPDDPAHPWASWAAAEGAGEAGRRPDMRSRWNADRDLAWESVRLERVVEISSTQHTARRLRHPAKVVRWRIDKAPADCLLDQLEVAAAPELSALFGQLG